jgi:hypothetical protein
MEKDAQAQIIFDTIVKNVHEVIDDYKAKDDMATLTFTNRTFLSATTQKDDLTWRTIKLPIGAQFTLESVRLGSRDILFGFFCSSGEGSLFCEVTRREAEANIQDFASVMMMLTNAKDTMTRMIGDLKPKGNVTVEKKPKKEKIEKPKPERSEMFGSW